MPRTTITPLTFAVVYFTQCDAPIRVEKIEARDYWMACRIAWNKVRRSRSQITDFQLIDDPVAIADGPPHIRAAAVAILAARKASRKAAA